MTTVESVLIVVVIVCVSAAWLFVAELLWKLNRIVNMMTALLEDIAENDGKEILADLKKTWRECDKELDA